MRRRGSSSSSSSSRRTTRRRRCWRRRWTIRWGSPTRRTLSCAARWQLSGATSSSAAGARSRRRQRRHHRLVVWEERGRGRGRAAARRYEETGGDRFKDYCRYPKANGYWSIHMELVVDGSSTVELQLRSRRMDVEAEHGQAQHNSYKSGIVKSSDDLVALGDVVARSRSTMGNVKVKQPLQPPPVPMLTARREVEVEVKVKVEVVRRVCGHYGSYSNVTTTTKAKKKAKTLGAAAADGEG